MGADWKSLLIDVGSRVEGRWDQLRGKVKEELGWLDPITILPFRGHGDASRVHLKGRVLEQGKLEKPSPDDDLWTTLVHMFHRFESDEVPGARVRASFEGRTAEVVSDGEGYLDIAFDGLNLGPLRSPEQRWRKVQLELLAPLREGQGRTVVTGQVLTPPATAEFGVISDVDDTIIRTGATDLIRNLRTTLLNTAEARMPFAGVAALYQALERGRGGQGANPIFYVSSSPWNLFDLLERFMTHNRIPIGPLFLRDLGWDRGKFIKGTHGEHKIATIQGLLDFYPDLPFILIGDSGQHDAMIYKQVVQENPGRIVAVYIRDVSEGARDDEIRALFEQAQGERTEVVLGPDLLKAAVHTADQGWIESAALASVRAEIEATRAKG